MNFLHVISLVLLSLNMTYFIFININNNYSYYRLSLYYIPVSHWAAAAVAKSLQSCPTLCDPIDSGPPGSPTPGILQARTLEWVAISFSNA